MMGSMSMSDPILADLTATIDSLGYDDGSNYHLDKNCIEVIKDLIRFLRRDDETNKIRRFLGDSKLLQNALLKIFVCHSDKIELWNVLLRLIINLTSPALMVYNEEIPKEKITRNFYLQILGHLQEYKYAMCNESVWTTVCEKLKKFLEIESDERTEETELLIERILILIRNVLRVPPSDNEMRTDNDSTVHDQVLYALNTSGVSDLLVYIASSNKEQQFHMQILEIVAFMLQNQNPAVLAKVELQRSREEKEADETKLAMMRDKERKLKTEKLRKYAGSRHSKFGGTYVVQNMKAIGDNEMLVHKPLQKIEDLDFGVTKQKAKKRKNKLGLLAPTNEERVPALIVRFFLKEFCVEFLNGAYNPVMRYARSCITGDAGSNNVDTSHYLWALRFFMCFNRHRDFQVKYVSETISTQVFYLVQRQIDDNYEMIRSDKGKEAFWSRRLHLAMKAYQELFHTLIEMNKSLDSDVKSTSKTLMSNIFYVPEYRDTILYQLLNYNEVTMSRDYLSDLVTTTHVFLKMLKNYCGTERQVIVQKKKRKKSKKKKTKASNKPSAGTESAAEPPPSLEDRWADMGPEVSAVMQQGVIPEVMPFDATIETPVDEQKGDAMKRIQKLLRCRDFEQAIGLLRSARDVWPDNDSFGRSGMPPEEEFLVLREIFLADLGVPDDPGDSTQTQKDQGDQIESLLNHDDEESEEEEVEEERSETKFEESNFDFQDFLNRFVNMRVVINLTILLRDFDKNSLELNHCLLKMFHRIAVECKMPAMLYQASIFRIFQRIFKSESREHKELERFARFIFLGFAEVAQRNPKAYMELLFWKSTKQAVEMTDGYDVEHTTTNKKAARNAWTEVEEEELRTLFMEHQTNKYPQDLIDYLLDNLINQDRTRRGVIKKLKEMCLIVNSKSIRSEVQKRLPKEWSEEEVAQLTELWESVKDEDDPVGLIYDSLRIKRSKPKIKEKLLELKLAEDPKQLRKKRTKKRDGPKSSWRNQSESEGSGSDSDDESGRSGSESRDKKKEKKKKKKSKQPDMLYTDAMFSGLLKDVIEKNMKEALQWLKNSLEESLKERDDESHEGHDLIPETTETSMAMDSPSFQKLMRAMGLDPPENDDSYWRVPATMLKATVTKRSDLIGAALRGEFVEEVAVSRRRDESDDDDGEDVFEKLKKLRDKNIDEEAAKKVSDKSDSEGSQSGKEDNDTGSNEVPKSPEKTSDQSDSESELEKESLAEKIRKSIQEAAKTSDENGSENSQSNKENQPENQNHLSEPESNTQNSTSIKSKKKKTPDTPEVPKKSKLKRLRKLSDSSDSEQEPEKSLIMENEEEESAPTSTQENSSAKTTKTDRISNVIQSDSEEDEEVAKEKSSPENKRDRSENSGNESPVQKKRRIIDSDEEDDAVLENNLSVERKQARILSDDED